MATEPVLSGDIPSGGVLEILRDIEVRRITGKIRFLVGGESGEVELVAGQIAMDQDALPSGADPVEALLQARGGIYAVHAVLPPLAVSQGNDHERRGSLAVHVPADLMGYCEQAGLTGVLEMRNEGRVVEVIYEAGEMLGIRLDGREEADLDQVFAWDQGSFRIAARTEEDVRSRLPPAMSVRPGAPSAAPPEDPADREPTVRYARPTPAATPIVGDGGATSRYAKVDASGREDTGRNFLRVIEMALTEVVSVREKARASVRSAPPPPKARPSVRPIARPARQKDPTVRIVWIGGEPSVENEIPAAARVEVPKAPRPIEPPKALPVKPAVSPKPADEPPSAKASDSATKASGADTKASDADAKASDKDASASEKDAEAEPPTPAEPSKPPRRASAETPIVVRTEAADRAAEPPADSQATIALLVAFLVGVAILAWFLVRG